MREQFTGQLRTVPSTNGFSEQLDFLYIDGRNDFHKNMQKQNTKINCVSVYQKMKLNERYFKV